MVKPVHRAELALCVPAGPAAAVPLKVSSAVITLTPEMEAETLAWTIRPNRPVMVASMIRV